MKAEYLNEEQCKVECGELTDNHIKLAVLLIRDNYLKMGKVAYEIFIDDLNEWVGLMKDNPNKNAFEIMNEELS